MKIVIIYDSKTGNTEKMAKALAKGASSLSDVELKKIGEAFTPSILGEADGVAFGSPVYYADISNNMKDFIEHLDEVIKANRLDIRDKPAAIFGSYGYDGAWTMEERLKARIENLGFTVFKEICVLIDTEVKYNTLESLEKCEEFGKKFAETL
jgi:flavorubredoxin